MLELFSLHYGLSFSSQTFTLLVIYTALNICNVSISVCRDTFSSLLHQVLTSDAVVLDWAQAIFGQWGVIFSFLVAASALGAAIASTFGITRQLMALAREGELQQLINWVKFLSNHIL